MAPLAAELAVWSIALPFIGGLASLIRPAKKRWGPSIGLATAGLLLFMTGSIAALVVRDGPARYSMGGWGQPLGIELHLDGLSALMLLVAAVVMAAVVVFARPYYRHDNDEEAKASAFFWPLAHFLWGGLNAVFLSSDVFNLYVSLEVLTLCAVGLVASAGSLAALAAATRYLLLALLGSLLYLFGVGILYSVYARLDIVELAGLLEPGLGTSVAVVLMLFGLLIKAALFPMHVWLPHAHARAPAPVSALLSGLVITAPFYLLVRLWFSLLEPVATVALGQLVGALGCLAILWGGIQALRQERLKLVVAYSTVSQLGYMFLLIPLAALDGPELRYAWNGGIYFTISHACAKAAAFLAAGGLLHALGHDRVDDLRGAAEKYPLLIMAFALAGVNLAGLPPSGGFVAKWMLLKAALDGGQWWYAAIIVLGGLLAAAYVFRVLEKTLPPAGDDTVGQRLPLQLQAPALALALVASSLGLASALPLDLLGIGAPASAGPIRALAAGVVTGGAP